MQHIEREPLDSKQALLESSIEIFAEKGLEGATVKDIADQAKVNVALINYYFGGKDGLYRAVLEAALRTRMDAIDQALKPVGSVEEFASCLRLFMEDFIRCHFENPHLMKIVHRDFDGPHPMAREVFKNIFLTVYTKLTGFVRSAQDSGILRPDTDCGCFVAYLCGSIIHSLRMDGLRKDLLGRSLQDEEFLNLYIDQFIKNLCEGAFNRSPA